MKYAKAAAEVVRFEGIGFMTTSEGGAKAAALADAQKDPAVQDYLASHSATWSLAVGDAYQGDDGMWYVEVNVVNNGGHVKQTFGPYGPY